MDVASTIIRLSKRSGPGSPTNAAYGRTSLDWFHSPITPALSCVPSIAAANPVVNRFSENSYKTVTKKSFPHSVTFTKIFPKTPQNPTYAGFCGESFERVSIREAIR